MLAAAACQVELKGSSIVDVPDELLVVVLQHVEQKERLQYCALVCRNWNLAAKLATCQVINAANSEDSVRSLSAWLDNNRHLSALQSIHMHKRRVCCSKSERKPSLQLPFAQLEHLTSLQLSSCCLEVAAKDAAAPCVVPAAGIVGTAFQYLAALKALSRLELNRTLADLCELGSCTGLQHLDLIAVDHVAAASLAADATAATRERVQPSQGSWTDYIATALPKLTQLTYLGVQPAAGAVVDQVGSLHNLQQLKLSSVSAEDLTQLPTSLRVLQLELQSSPRESAVTPDSVPWLQQLTQLQHLHLSYVWEFDAVLLFNLKQLTWLHLSGRDLKYDNATVIERLMAGLQQSKQLKHLGMAGCLSAPHEEQHPAEVYAPLTSSSYLTYLDIDNCFFPPRASEHVFGAANALRSLKVLVAGKALFTLPGSFDRLVACCPALEVLDVLLGDWGVPRVMGPDDAVGVNVQGLSALSRLLSLTKLVLNRLDLTDAAMRHISACPQLRDLAVNTQADSIAPLTAAGMLYLTQLTALTRCKLDVEFMEDWFAERVQVFKCSSPDVYLQLQRLFLLKLAQEARLQSREFRSYSNDGSQSRGGFDDECLSDSDNITQSGSAAGDEGRNGSVDDADDESDDSSVSWWW